MKTIENISALLRNHLMKCETMLSISQTVRFRVSNCSNVTPAQGSKKRPTPHLGGNQSYRIRMGKVLYQSFSVTIFFLELAQEADPFVGEHRNGVGDLKRVSYVTIWL